MSRNVHFVAAADQYRSARDEHARTLVGDGCRCGHKATGIELHKHISTAVTKASRAHHDEVTRRR